MAGENQLTGAEAVVRLLQGHGVRHVFGLCGDTSLPFYDALARLDHGMTHILTRDERHAAYMAEGYARVTGQVGICEGPSGGGATYIAPGLVEANESSIPVLAITTDVATTSAGRYPLTDLDQRALFAPLTKWNAVLDKPETLPRKIRAAFRAMTTGKPGSAHLALPFDVQKAPAPADDLWSDPRFGRWPALPAGPNSTDLHALAEALHGAARAVVVVGGGAVHAGAELARLAEGLDLPVCATISGRNALAETHPNMLGVVGSNGGRPATRAVVDAADCVLFVGCRAGSVTTERWRSPSPGTRVLHIDIDPLVIGANYQTEAAVCADARLALGALADLTPGDHKGFQGAEIVRKAKAGKRAAFAPLAESDETPIRPERVIAALDQALQGPATVVADPGTPCPYMSAYLQTRGDRILFSNRAHGALGYAMGAAVGAAVGRPSAKTVCLMGDGSFGFSVGELETVVRLGLPITFIVFSNAVYGWIKAGQKSGFGARYFSVDFDRTDHAAVARAYGLQAETVADPRALAPALARALSHDGPALVDVIAQPLHEAAAPVSEWVA